MVTLDVSELGTCDKAPRASDSRSHRFIPKRVSGTVDGQRLDIEVCMWCGTKLEDLIPRL